MKNSWLIVAFSVIFIIACATSDRLYEKGKYAAAIKKAVSEIEDNNHVGKEKRMLNKAYKAEAEVVKSEVKELQSKGLTEEKTLRQSIKAWKKFMDLDALSAIYLTDENLITSREAKTRLVETENALYEVYIAQAVDHMQAFESSGQKLAARRSYESFRKAKNIKFEKDEFPLEDMETMLFYAIERVNVVIDIFENEVQQEFKYNLDRQQTYQIFYIDENKDKTDCQINIDCLFFDIDDEKTDRTETFREQVQDGYTTSTDTAGNVTETPKYIIVEALVTETKITREAEWRIDFEVRDISGSCTLRSDSFRPQRKYELITMSYQGDKRALPSNYENDPFQDDLPDESDIKEEMAEMILQYFEDNY